jgi:pescadillo protein
LPFSRSSSFPLPRFISSLFLFALRRLPRPSRSLCSSDSLDTGIYPREPTNKKKANKGSSAPASFYYSKDILYLLHEPLLAKFREHKTFAKKLARALGRGEWALAKGLEERKPLARLDHLVKERYPTFKQALADLNDPLSLLSLFERLPRDPVPGKTQVPTEVTAECGKLLAEWKIWAIRTHALRKVFLSIKGVYYECEVPAGRSGETVNVRWLEPWEFKQTVRAIFNEARGERPTQY